MDGRRTELLAGIRDELPIAIGVIPFGLIYGVLALDAALSVPVAQSMSAIVFAGSAQFIGAQLFREAAPALVLIATTFIVNLRHVLYSASLLPYIGHLPARWKWLLAYLLTDEAYATTIIHYTKPGTLRWKHYYFLGSGLTLWVAWQLSTAAGIALGAQIPAGWGLDFTLALTFIGLVVPTLTRRPLLGAALAAGTVATLSSGLPYRLGLLAAALTGIAVGVLLERRASAGEPAP